VAILVVLGYRFGAEPFLDALRQTDVGALLVALAVTAATTWCCARRWSLLAQRLDVTVPVRSAYRACYRAQFLNVALPGGVAGDVHRGIRHGRDTRAMGRALKSVVWDRVTGQVVQVGLVVLAIPFLPSGLRVWALGVATCLALFVVVFRAEIRTVLGAPGVGSQVALLSALAAAGHVLVFVVAARTAGVTAPLHEVVPLALGVLLASAIPLNIAGWGPREGAAAWAFGAAGLGAGVGLQVAVVYGVMALVATLPGALMWGPASARPAENRTRGGSAWATGPTSS
jgi:glycosyltransferase 2 family protein